jgi:hypothetical protein
VKPSADEQELAARAIQLIGNRRSLTPAEKALVPCGARLSDRDIETIRNEIREGLDPLGLDFIRLRSPEIRRGQGAVYTPSVIVEAMTNWALAEPGDRPVRVVDPGSGSGRFLISAAVAFPKASLIAIENDPLAALILRANATASGFIGRLTIHLGDYRTYKLPPISGRTLFSNCPGWVVAP